MDNIKQYQRLSNIKPSYQKLTKPYYGVNRIKIERNAMELDLYFKEQGLWEEDKNHHGQNKSKNKKGGYDSKITLLDVSDLIEI